MAEKSGKYWVKWANTHANPSSNIEDLESVFKSSVKEFIKALEDAGITVKTGETKRSKERALLYHWSWKIALGKCKASDADNDKMPGVDIQWDHGNDDESKAGAQEMVDGFHLAVPPKSTVAPAKTSTHIEGKAIDMTITWSGEKEVKKKNQSAPVKVIFNPDVNQNAILHEIGESYGIKKLKNDAPHWSYNGK